MLVFCPTMVHGVTPLKLSIFNQIRKKKRKTVTINADIMSFEPWKGSVNEELYNEQLSV